MKITMILDLKKKKMMNHLKIMVLHLIKMKMKIFEGSQHNVYLITLRIPLLLLKHHFFMTELLVALSAQNQGPSVIFRLDLTPLRCQYPSVLL